MPAVPGRHKIATDSLPPDDPVFLLFLFASRRSVRYKCERKVRPLSKARRETGSRFAAASCLFLCLPAFAGTLDISRIGCVQLSVFNVNLFSLKDGHRQAPVAVADEKFVFVFFVHCLFSPISVVCSYVV